MSLVVAETNNATENPLWHGEVHCLKRYFEMPEEGRTPLKDCFFLATHEPCSLCLSAITWAGLDNFVYLVSYEEGEDAYGMPLDLKILQVCLLYRCCVVKYVSSLQRYLNRHSTLLNH